MSIKNIENVQCDHESKIFSTMLSSTNTSISTKAIQNTTDDDKIIGNLEEASNSNLGLHETRSLVEVGEESEPQDLRRNFTPSPGFDDDEELIDKLQSVWNVHDEPQLKKIVELPIPDKSISRNKSQIASVNKPRSQNIRSSSAISQFVSQVKFAKKSAIQNIDISTLKMKQSLMKQVFQRKFEERGFNKENEQDRQYLKKVCMEMDKFDKRVSK